MKTFVFTVLLTLGIGLLLGTLMGIDSGYVLISFSHYTLETSLWAYIGLTLLLMVLLYVLMRSFLLLIGRDWHFNEWRARQRSVRARRQTTRGFLALVQGQLRRAERLLTLNAKDSDTPLINYIAAAHAAFEQGKMEAAEQWLKEARDSTPGSQLAVSLQQAEMMLSQGKQEQALAVLVQAYRKYPKNAHVVKRLVEVYIELKDWVALHELLPVARRITRISSERLQQLEENVHLELLQRAAHHQGLRAGDVAAELQRVFQAMPRAARSSMPIVKRYIELLMEAGDEALAEQSLRRALKQVWHDDLVNLYGQVHSEDAAKQLLFAEQQTKERPNDPMLLLVVGRLARRVNQLDKAAEYLQAGLRLTNLPELHIEMAKLRMAEGDESRACEHFRLALK